MISGRVESRILFALLVMLSSGALLVTCSAPPRNGWTRQWGPTVPHSTFPGDCGLCHEGGGWERIRGDFSFDHEEETGFALEGAHQRAACLRCHNDHGSARQFAVRGCAGCHRDPHQARLGGECTLCHNEEQWRPQGLIGEHASTRFPLAGRHAAVACARCHTRAPAGDYRGAPLRCEACHQADLARATLPDHAANGWVDSCERCHAPTGWGRGGFSHAFFPLTGGHALSDCSRCHTSGFNPIPASCYSCHQADYQAAPDHVTGNFSRSCESCHTTSGWSGAAIDHTFFALTAGHGGLQCSACHKTGIGPLPSDCYSCHRTEYDGAPDHVSGNFARTCENCHTTSGWPGAAIDHTFFALTAGHGGLQCSACHKTGIGPLPSDCYSCHQADYNGAPNHVSGNFARTCKNCHTTSRWSGATIDHTFFALTAGHGGLQCSACHKTGIGPLPNDCYSCHQADYNGAPNHAAFPRTCKNCHTTTRWTGAVFNHTRFPLQGKHNKGCGTCHTTNSPPAFSCLDCHGSSNTDRKHGKVSGYSYNSAACYQCHPNGRG